MTENNPNGPVDPAEPTQVTPGSGATEYIGGWPQNPQGQQHAQGQPNPQGPPQQPYGAPQYAQQAGYSGGVPQPGYNPAAYGQQPGYGYAAAPAGPSFFSKAPLAVWLSAGSGIAGIITFFMGLVPWIVINESLGERAEDWAKDNFGDCNPEAAIEGYDDCAFEMGVPAFSSPNLILSPGFFFVVLGVAALVSLVVALPNLRKFIPLAGLITAGGFLAMFAAFFGMPVLEMGAGAITGLIFGFLQLLLIGAAIVAQGLRKDDAE